MSLSSDISFLASYGYDPKISFEGSFSKDLSVLFAKRSCKCVWGRKERVLDLK